MDRCQLCYNLEKKEADDFRLALDFAPEQLLASKNSQKCIACAFILEGILRFEDETWTFAKDTSRVYLYALEGEGDSLTLEVYFKDDRPKLMLEFFVREDEESRSESRTNFIQPSTILHIPCCCDEYQHGIQHNYLEKAHVSKANYVKRQFTWLESNSAKDFCYWLPGTTKWYSLG
jgi:hypothetical protein